MDLCKKYCLWSFKHVYDPIIYYVLSDNIFITSFDINIGRYKNIICDIFMDIEYFTYSYEIACFLASLGFQYFSENCYTM